MHKDSGKHSKDQPSFCAPTKPGCLYQSINQRNGIMEWPVWFIGYSVLKTYQTEDPSPQSKKWWHILMCEAPYWRRRIISADTTSLLKFPKRMRRNILWLQKPVSSTRCKNNPIKHSYLLPLINTVHAMIVHMKLNTLEKLYLCMEYEMCPSLLWKRNYAAAKNPLPYAAEISVIVYKFPAGNSMVPVQGNPVFTFSRIFKGWYRQYENSFAKKKILGLVHKHCDEFVHPPHAGWFYWILNSTPPLLNPDAIKSSIGGPAGAGLSTIALKFSLCHQNLVPVYPDLNVRQLTIQPVLPVSLRDCNTCKNNFPVPAGQ